MKILNSNFFIFCGLAILAFLLFGNGINGDFVFDDRSVIVGNPLIEESSGFFRAFLNPYHYARPQSGLYRPLTFASFVLDWHVFSGNPAGFHVVNILLHAVSSFLIFLIVLNLKDRMTALASSLLFLFLPIHVEAVTSIVGRGELLMFLFFLSALYSFQKKFYKIAALLFFLSLLSKETGIAFIPIFIFFELFWRKTRLADLFTKSLYFIASLVVYAIFRYNALGYEYFVATNAYSFFNPIKEMEFLPGLWTAFKVLYLYIQKTIFPTYFSSDYSYNQITEATSLFNSWQALAGVLMFASMIVLAIVKRKSLIGFGAVIFLFSYLIVSNLFIKIGTIMAERLMYMPSLGLIFIFVAPISNWLKVGPSSTVNIIQNVKIKAQNDNSKFKILDPTHKFYILIFAFLILLIWYGWVIIDRNKDWLNEKSLFESAYKNAPNSVVNITNMASILFREGKNREALEKTEIALEIESRDSPTLHLAGQIYKKIGQDKTAEEFWRRGIQIQPDYLYPYLSLGTLYYQRGDFKSGEEVLTEAKKIYNTPNVMSLLAFNQVGLEEYDNAINLIEDNFGEKPKVFELRFILGVAYLKSGDNSRAGELLLELKDPALTEEKFFQNLKKTKIFDIEI